MSKNVNNPKNVKVTPKKENTLKSIKEKIVTLPNFPIYIPVIIFIITTCIYFGSQLFGNSYFWEDFLEFIYPTQSFAAKELAKGNIPFWNPFSFGGMPFFADLQVGFFYPFNRVLNLFLGNDYTLPIWILQFIIILHYFFAQINYYIFAKYLKISSIGAIIGAIAYSFAFPLVLHVIHPMIIYHLAWFPLIFFFFKKALDFGSIRYGSIAGLIFGVTMLSGHPQITLYFAFILGIYFIWDLASKFLKKEKYNSKSFVGGLLTFILAVGIFMIQFLPSNDMAKYSARAVTNYEKSAENSLQFKQVWTLLTPKIFGHYEGDSQTDYPVILNDTYDGKETQVKNNFYWETAIYFGVFPFLFGLFGLFSTKKDSFKWFLVTIIVFGFLYALGKNFPLHKLFYSLPFFGTFRNPVRMFTFSMFGLSLFAGFAFDEIVSRMRDKKLLINFLIVFGIGLIVVFLSQIGALQSILSIPEQYIELSSGLTTTVLVLLLFSILIGYLYIRNTLNPMIAGTLFILIVFLDLYLQGSTFTKSSINPQEQYVLNPELKQLLQAKPPKEVFRVKTRLYSPSYMAVKRNQGLIDNLYMLEGYNPLMLKLAQIPTPGWTEALQLMNVKYDLKYDPNQRNVAFYENTNRLGAAFLVGKARYISTEKAPEFMKKNIIDYSKEALIQSNSIDFAKYNYNDSLPVGTVTVLQYSPNKMNYKVRSDRNSIMVFSEIYYPNWKAKIDGKLVSVLQANNSFRAIEMPAGKHMVEMYYEDSKFSTGIYITLASLCLSVFLIFFFRKNEI